VKPYRVLVVQTRPRFGEVQHNLRSALALAERGVRRFGADLLVLPELFATGYAFETRREAMELGESARTGEKVRRLQEFSGDLGLSLVAGHCERAGKALHNSAVAVALGRSLGVYRKVHLFDEEKRWFTAGRAPWPVYRMGAARVGVMICFDWRFPEAARALALSGAEVLAHPSNLVLPHCQEAMRTRALENRIYCVTANRVGEDRRPGKVVRFTGGSQIVDPGGTVLGHASRVRAGLVAAPCDLAKARDKRINSRNDLMRDRAPSLYGRLARR